MKIGCIGLGRMGKNMALHLLEQGIEVVAWNRSSEPLEEVRQAGAIAAESIEDLVSKLGNGKVVVWLMLPAGETTDEFINKLLPLLSKEDLIIDGANSFYKDTLKRSEKIRSKGVHFMDIGVSGGPAGARSGACLMIGGSQEDFLGVEPLLRLIAAPDAYQHLGPIGAGHFAKMVHNGIEYGMMESLAEGLAVIKNGPFKFDFNKLLDIYNHRSVIESRLIGWAKNAFDEDPSLENISSTIGSGGSGKRILGEADWTVEIAKEIGVGTPAIENAIKVRENSEKDEENSPNGFRNKVISALRGQFGQHDVRKK